MVDTDREPQPTRRWQGQTFIIDGYVWGTYLTEDRELATISLGKEDKIVPILRGEKPLDNLPNDTDGYKRRVLQRILEEDGIEYVGSDLTERSVERGRTSSPPGDRERTTGLSKASKRVPRSASRAV